MTHTTSLRIAFACLATLSTAACASEMPEESRHYTKEEARDLEGTTDAGLDICELEDWYGDMVCDDFCVGTDPDCAACAASCEPGETAHRDESDCPQDASCREVTVCDETIWCSDTVSCDTDPSCRAGERRHESASDCPADASCREVTECGTTIWCSDTATCAGLPSCRPGERAHESASDCPADASCREVTECGATIWCSSTDAPVCSGDDPAGCVATECADGYHCDTTMGSAPSACECDPENGSWVCTTDVSGGICVAD